MEKNGQQKEVSSAQTGKVEPIYVYNAGSGVYLIGALLTDVKYSDL